MPYIAHVETTVPPHKIDQEQGREFARRHFGAKVRDVDRLLGIFANSGIDHRYFSKPLDWLVSPHTLEERNTAYIENATTLAADACRSLFARTGTRPDQIDYIMFVNTTGLATPSIDARLINVLGLRHNVRRTPIWGLGCAGGVAGLSHAYHHALGHPKQRILLVAAELCGLTFLPNDFSKSNLVATALFGEGAAAVLITGDDVAQEGVRVVDTCSRLYPDSLDVMGWNVVAHGLQVVFAQRIPDIVAEHSREDLSEFLRGHQLTLDDIDHYLFHPGGTKVIQAYQEALGRRNGEFEISCRVLRDYGNMSSVTVLFVLAKFLESNDRKKGELGLISALGPGFSSETVLIES